MASIEECRLAADIDCIEEESMILYTKNRNNRISVGITT